VAYYFKVIIPKKIGSALREYPRLIALAAGAMKVTADIADWAHDKWSRYQEDLFKSGTRLIRDVSNDISQYAIDLEEYRKNLAASQARRRTHDENIAWADLRQIIIEGKPIPENWQDRIKYLDLSHEAALVDVSNLSVLENLEELSVARTNVFDLSPLASLSNLTRLELSRTNVNNIRPLSSLQYLKRLDLDGLKIKNIDTLRSLVNLEELDLSRTEVSDIDVLRTLSRLRKLDLSSTKITGVGPISNLEKLEYLDISNTAVTNLFAISRLRDLKELHITGTKIPESEYNTILSFLHLQVFSPP
jgi:Leucine-rich repeat (LRR) protein